MYKNLRSICIRALRAAYNVHEDLGVQGEELVRKNQFGDTALRVDVACEAAVLKTLKKNGVPIKVISEEHGTTQVGEHAEYLGILDGLDGSLLYKDARGRGRYGTMFAIFAGTDPTYDDYIFCGIMQHATQRLYIAEKGRGACVITGGGEQRIRTSGKRHLDKDITLYIDEYFEYNRAVFSGPLAKFGPKCELSSSLYYAALAEGAADAVLECTRKGNLEIAVAYGLTRESGGVVVDLGGEDIGNKKYAAFMQPQQAGIISAATSALAEDILAAVGNHPRAHS